MVCHRLWLRTDRPDVPLANLIVRDDIVDLRREAVARFDRWLGGGALSLSSGFLPSAFQARRFTMMLDILDLLSSAVDRGITTHEIARRIVYPRMAIARGSEWKSSSERRRVQRLIAQARSLMNGGYRALLAGLAGRQKLP